MDAATTLRRARATAGLSLRELAQKAGTSHSTLAAYEGGRKVPTADTLARVVGAAGFDLVYQLQPRPAGIDLRERERELRAVLHLAAQFPARHDADLQAPVFGR